MAALTAMLTALVCALMPVGPTVGRGGSAFDPMTSAVALTPTKRVSPSGDRALTDPEKDRTDRRQAQRAAAALRSLPLPAVVEAAPPPLAAPGGHALSGATGTAFALHGLPGARGPPDI